MSDFNAVLPEDLTIGVYIYIYIYHTYKSFYSVFNLQFTQHHNLFAVGIVNEINSWIFVCVFVGDCRWLVRIALLLHHAPGY